MSSILRFSLVILSCKKAVVLSLCWKLFFLLCFQELSQQSVQTLLVFVYLKQRSTNWFVPSGNDVGSRKNFARFDILAMMTTKVLFPEIWRRAVWLIITVCVWERYASTCTLTIRALELLVQLLSPKHQYLSTIHGFTSQDCVGLG